MAVVGDLGYSSLGLDWELLKEASQKLIMTTIADPFNVIRGALLAQLFLPRIPKPSLSRRLKAQSAMRGGT